MHEKICSKCNLSKPLGEFNKNKTKPDGYQSYCRLCSKASNNYHYYLNKKTRQRIYDRNRRWRQEAAQRVFHYLLDHPCVDCGEANPVLLQFDHQGHKVADLSRMVGQAWSWEKIAEEIVKCEVRCANCHTLRTAKQFNWLSYRLARNAGFDM
ncbi:bacteriophage protein [Gloeobacter kilaueensis JS1]|uniref:Bacteriophage protein n=1 Tax=Gloeobacter kilaueensis (strain ATCC BAA-2537 / CCAP 1431/1 / ULC 316 / JS1) TaxID=1183438 RepID=U5QIB4_GLOK1|nr:bacteriophage protein [Gloeobacter kilaueensis JS1]